VTWINIGTALGYGLASEFQQAIWTSIVSPNISESGSANLAGSWCDISIEGTLSVAANQNTISDAIDRQSAGAGGDHPAYGICYNYATSSHLSGYQFYGNADVGYGNNDEGALFISNSRFITVDGMNTYFDYGVPLQIQKSKGIIAGKSIFRNTGASGDSIHAVSVDSFSSDVILSDIEIDDSRGTPYSKGIDIGGSPGANDAVTNVIETNLVTSPDSLGGAVVSNYIGGIPFGALSTTAADGSAVLCLGCKTTNSTLCSVGAPANCVCAPVTGSNAYAKRLNAMWYCGGV
jgi:hypothetical protein